MAVKTYDPTKLSIIVNTHSVTGTAPDSEVSIAFQDVKYGTDSDNQGAVTRFKKTNNIMLVTITLTQSSISNNVFSSFLELDRVNNAGIFSLMIKDGSGSSVFTCPDCFIEQMPKVDYANENKNREWQIYALNPTAFLGGIN